MKRNLFKVFSLLLCVIFVFGVFNGCSSNQSNKPSPAPTAPAASTTPTGPEPLTLPIVSTPLTLTCFWPMDPKHSMTVKSYAEIAFFKEMAKRTGITLNFIQPSVGDADVEQFNLMFASRNLPDMIAYPWMNPSKVPEGPAKYISDGFIIKLNDAYAKYAPNITKTMAEHPDWKLQATLDDGSYWMIPKIKADRYLLQSGGFQVRKDWLDMYGLALPKTIDDWYKVLTTFKQKDPNGNGKNDEIPYAGDGTSSAANTVKSFIYSWGIYYGFYMDGKTVKFGPYEPAFKDYADTMAKWCKEGLIGIGFGATDKKAFDNNMLNNNIGSYNGTVNGQMGPYLDMMKAKYPKFDLAGVANPIGSTGKSLGGLASPVTVFALALTSANKHVKESVKYWDYVFGQEGNMLGNWGVEGESYTMVNGKPQLTDNVLRNYKNLPITNALCQYTLSASDVPGFQTEALFRALQLYPQQQAAEEAWTSSDNVLTLPPALPTPDEGKQLQKIMADINTYVDESLSKYVTGAAPLNFDTFRQTLKSMGIENAIKIQQGIVDRYNARKK